jgi:hypothetical protein
MEPLMKALPSEPGTMGSRYRMEISTMTESLTWLWFPPVPIR